MPPIADLTIDPSLRTRLQQGHPWVYRNHLIGAERLDSGQWVRARCGGLTVYGLYDARSPIGLRIYSRNGPPDQAWIHERVWEAWELRAPLRDNGQTTAYRWIYGEGDHLPGIVVDRYGDYAVIQTYAESVQTIVPTVAAALRAVDPQLRGVVQRPRLDDDDADEARPVLLWGEWPPRNLVVQENGLFFHVDMLYGQKTGLFLDQRDNRRTLEGFVAGASVLNCFAYTGGFSLYALRGDAAEVVSCDVGRGLAEATAANIALNRLPVERHHFETEDCFSLLDSYAKVGRTFNVVILDPPSFARSRTNLHAAQRAYIRLNMLGLRCVEPGGLLISSSCTAQIGPEQFRHLLGEAAAQAHRRLQIIHEAGQPLDHPVPAGFPEGRYLKFIIARVQPLV
ncbi:class I SAM-dependent rRNA methyltransferase [Chloroflexus aggregans]|uniref:SAM-dependent methyltransferase n=1 Tax=Chloroflexus aggregans (strain MD-66 / DSM 9485) TaxID=326427 RepID=B8GB35_CHLAD|nr:class I SAM-dependent rRNA methyltransferase [Chloroflexus aggregans]ACL26635.1 SAM-dependent methyltransferase [Chloroflexus aggregans DSM 9485]